MMMSLIRLYVFQNEKRNSAKIQAVLPHLDAYEENLDYIDISHGTVAQNRQSTYESLFLSEFTIWNQIFVDLEFGRGILMLCV